MKLKIQEVEYHRNGVGGDGFFAIRFYDKEEKGNMIGIVFKGLYDDKSAQCPVAVLNVDKLKGPDASVAFGFNSWRGDRYAPDLYAACTEWENK